MKFLFLELYLTGLVSRDSGRAVEMAEGRDGSESPSVNVITSFGLYQSTPTN